MKNKFFIFIICWFAPLAMLLGQTGRYAEPVFSKAMVTRGIPFSFVEKDNDNGWETLYFDFYEPPGDTIQARPLVITVFGGAFVAGSRDFSDMEEYCTRLAKLGYTAASIDYRLMSVFSASAKNIIREIYMASQDVSAAVRFFKAHCDEYRIDTNNIFLLGNSAGSIAILHELFMSEEERPAETWQPPALNEQYSSEYCDYYKYSSDVAGAVAQWGGVLDLDFIDSADCVPLCLIHGTADETVPYDSGYCYSSSFSSIMPYMYGSLPISERLLSIGCDSYEFHPIQNEEHAFYLSSFYQLIGAKFDVCYNIVHDFLLNNLDFSWQEEVGQNNTDSIQGDEDFINTCYDTPFDFEVFPNPAKWKINVKCNSSNIQSFDIQLFNLCGSLLETVKYVSGEVQIDISDYAAGIYFLKFLKNGKIVGMRKIVMN